MIGPLPHDELMAQGISSTPCAACGGTGLVKDRDPNDSTKGALLIPCRGEDCINGRVHLPGHKERCSYLKKIYRPDGE